MKGTKSNNRTTGWQRWAVLAIVAGAMGMSSAAQAQNTKFDIYGFAMMDMGYQSKQNAAEWFDVLRPTKLPSVKDEFGKDGRFFTGVRQTRIGFKSFTPTDLGELRTTFEFEMFGTGVDQGQTTMRLRHAYGELGQFGFGQTWSPFMDIDVFPNSIEYWGPNGMAFFRNVQARWMPIQGDNRLTIALERPGASGDAGDYAFRVESQEITSRFPLPDLSGEYRIGQTWGYIEAAGIVRQMNWDDNVSTLPDLTGDAVGWGLNFSSNIKAGRGTARLSVVYGEGIENYMNDAPADIGVEAGLVDTIGVALPVTGVSAFYDINWNDRWSSTAGYSMVDIDNSNLQAGAAFRTGQYALANLLYYPAKNVMLGGEIQWGDRENKNGFKSEDVRYQFSARYNFSMTIGGGQ